MFSVRIWRRMTSSTWSSSTPGNHSVNSRRVAPPSRFSKEGLNGNPDSPEDPRSAELVGAALDNPAVLPVDV